jgi:uncharacterized protein (DUF302 family)
LLFIRWASKIITTISKEFYHGDFYKCLNGSATPKTNSYQRWRKPMVNYGLSQQVALPFETVLKKIPIELRRKGFEVISNVRIDNELHKHIGVEFKRYALLGVCNIPLSYKALVRDDLFGLVLTCSIVIFEKGDETVVGLIRPSVFMELLENESINQGALTIERKLTEVLETVGKKRFHRNNKKDSEHPLDYEKAVA